MRKRVLTLLALLGLSSGVHGATLTLNSADVQVNSDGTFGAVNDYQSRIGEYFAPGGAAYVLPFQLPTLAPGEVFTATNLRTQLFEKGNIDNTLGNADLYGIDVRSDPTVLASDYFQGSLDAGAFLIQDNFLTPSSTVRTDVNAGPFVETDAAGDAALAAYLNLAYAGGANAGQYVFLRVSYDLSPIPQGNSYYALLTEGAGGTTEDPLLTYETAFVPEPTALAAVAAAGVFFLRRRRA